MSEPSTEELELASLLGRVMSAPLAPLREHGAKLEKGLSSAVSESSKSSQLISSSLDSISHSQKRIVSALADLEELPEQLQQLARHLEKIRGAALTVDQVHQLLERHAREQHVLTEQGQEKIQEAFGQQQQGLVALNAQIIKAKDEQSLQLQERFEQSDSHLGQVLEDRTQTLENKLTACAQRIQLIGGHLAKLQNASLTADQVKQLLEAETSAQQGVIKQGQEQVQATLRQNLQGVAALESHFNRVSTAMSSQLQERLEHVELRLGQEVHSLTQCHSQQLSKTFKWVFALGVMNLAGLVACAVWIALQH